MSSINTQLSIRHPRQLTGTLITFRDSNVYNTRAVPGTSDITANYTAANLGTIQKIYHQDSVTPSVPPSWIQLTDSPYMPGELNILNARYIGNGEVEYWWNQPQLSLSTNHFDPLILTEDNLSGSDLIIEKESGNLIAVNVNAAVTSYNIEIANDWISTEVGTFRIDLVVSSGQTITFDSNIEGITDLNIPASGVASLLFDKPYGTTTWYVRQAI